MNTSDSERYECAFQIVRGAHELTGKSRNEYIENACGSDTALREEVLAVLSAASDERGEDMLAERQIQGARSALEGIMGESPRPPMPDKIGEYTVVRQIGEGGMGVVYEAQQESPRRSVAIKLLHTMHTTDESSHRFRREAELLGRLQHPGIAQIFEAGTFDAERGPQHFLSMELVDGESIDDFAAAHDLSVAARLELIASLCDALHYAHEKGVLHRDLKPANILVTTEALTPASADRSGLVAMPQPKILDFGVARALDSDLGTVTLQTLEGQLVGTVPYMSPEQAAGDPGGVDARSDVYAVGLIAYELMAGCFPYEVRGKLVHEAVRMIREDEPSRLSVVDRTLRGDVETIVAKALEKDRERRYWSAAELAADIRRHLSDEPIAARPPSTLYQLKKFARRNRVLVGGAITTLLVAVAGALVASGYAVDALQRASELERANYLSGITAAQGALQQEDYVMARAYLDKSPEAHRGWEYDHLRAQLSHHTDQWAAPAEIVSTPALDPEGGRVLAAMANGVVGSWSVASGALLDSWDLGAQLGIDDMVFGQVILHGPSAKVAVRSGDRAIDLVRLKPDGRFERLPSPVGQDQQPSGPDTALHAWDATGERLLYRDGGTRIWNGHESQLLDVEPFWYASFDPSSERVVVGVVEKVVLFDLMTNERIAERELGDVVTDLEFDPRGASLAVACHYRSLYLLDPDSLETLGSRVGHQDMIANVSWDSDGSHLVSASIDGSARVWESAEASPPMLLSIDESPMPLAVFLSGDEYVLVASGQLRRYPLVPQDVLREPESGVAHVCFSPDGSLLAASTSNSRSLHLWEVNGSRYRGRLEGPRVNTQRGSGLETSAFIAFSANGRRLVATSSTETRNWDVQEGTQLPVAEGNEPMTRFRNTLGTVEHARPSRSEVAVDAAGERVAAGHLDGKILVYATDPKIVRPGLLNSFAVQIAVEQPIAGVLAGHVGPVVSVAFSPDGSRLASGGYDTTVRIWDTRTMEQLVVLRGHEQYVTALAFSPDGTLLASGSNDKTIRLWDSLPPGERR